MNTNAQKMRLPHYNHQVGAWTNLLVSTSKDPHHDAGGGHRDHEAVEEVMRQIPDIRQRRGRAGDVAWQFAAHSRRGSYHNSGENKHRRQQTHRLVPEHPLALPSATHFALFRTLLF